MFLWRDTETPCRTLLRWSYQLMLCDHTPRCSQLRTYSTKVRALSEPGGTRWRTGGEVKGKLANGVGSQYSHTTSERGLSSITNADALTLAASSRLNWRPHRFKWTRPFRGKTKSGFCACAIRFRTSYITAVTVCCYVHWQNLPYTCLCLFCLNLSVTHNLRFHSVEILCVISDFRTSVCTHFTGFSCYNCMPTYIERFYFHEVRAVLMASRNKADRYRLRCQMYVGLT